MQKSWMSGWRHVFKLDPERTLSEDALEAVCLSGTDAIMVGGSTGVTFDNTVDLLARIRRFEVPCVLELTSVEAAVPGFDGYLVPMVLNSPEARWLIGQQAEAIERYGSFMPWEDTLAEGYIILNADAEAARLTAADTSLSAEAVVARVRVADRLLRLPIVYLEYSGCFGDMTLVRRARASLTQARLFYGGGIDNAARAGEAAAAADTIVVGNVIYSDLSAALATVGVVKAGG